MDIVQRIKELLPPNQTIAGLERELGFSNGSIKKWVTSEMSAEKLFKVAQHLTTTVEYILTGDNPITYAQYSKTANKIATIYDHLDEDSQSILWGEALKLQRDMKQTPQGRKRA